MSNKYKTTLRIHQVLSTDIVIETNEVPTNKTSFRNSHKIKI